MVLCAAGSILFSYFLYKNHQEKQAQTALACLLEQEEPTINELKTVADKYPSTKAGNTARYKLGQAHMADKAYQKAIKAFQKCKPKNNLVKAEKLYYISHCYAEINQLNDALNFAKRAQNTVVGCQAKYLDHTFNIYESIKQRKTTNKGKRESAKAQLSIAQKVCYTFANKAESPIYKKMVAAKENLAQEIKNLAS